MTLDEYKQRLADTTTLDEFRAVAAQIHEEVTAAAESQVQLWMATRRRDLDHHRFTLGALCTWCGRWAVGRGVFVTPEEAAELGSRPCTRCWPATEQP